MATWNVVSTVPDTQPTAPSKWNVVSTVRDPQEGDSFTGGELPQGFYAVTGDDGKQTLRRELDGGDLVSMLGDLPGVGAMAHVGEAAYQTGKKALAGLAGIATGGDVDTVNAIRGGANPEMGTFGQNDPVLRGLGAATEAIGNAVQPVDEAIGNMSPGARTAVEAAEEAIPDVAALTGARLPLKGIGPTVEDAAAAVKNAVKAPRESYRAAAGVEKPWFKAGLRTGGGHPIAREVAGESGREALKGHNVEVGNAIAARDAGHPDGPMTYESLAQAREAPNAVYNRVARILPEGPLDDIAKSSIQNAGAPEGGRMSSGSPQAQQAISKLKEELLSPDRSFTGQQMVNELRGLRQEGFVNIASEDVSNQQLGKAQIAIARALEDHISRNIPKGGDVTLNQFQAARKELAKNWAVQGALRGNDVDLKAIGRLHRNDPQLLDGGLKMLGEFAEGEGKDVVAIPNRYDEPSALRDFSHVWNFHRPVQSTIQGIPGVGSSARRFLTGSTEKAVEAAQRAFPTGNPDRFNPVPGLRPPPGRVGRPGLQPPEQLSLGDLAQAETPLPPPGMRIEDYVPALQEAAIGRQVPTIFPPESPAAGLPARPIPADVGLGDVLAQGVEQPGAPGLSFGPMGAPAGEGLPFQMSPEMIGARVRRGGAPETEPARSRVALGDRFARSPQPEKLGDVAAVRSQGVPEDIAQRTSSKAKVRHEADEDTGEHTVTSTNGSTRGQESGPYLLVKRSDTAKAAQRSGEGLARMEAMVQQAEHRGLVLGSDVSVSPAQQRVYAALKRRGYDVKQNPAEVNPDTGNLVSADPRKPVFEVRSKLAMAVE